MKKIIICGLGALGTTYASSIKDKCDLRILVDNEHLKKYSIKKPAFNGVEQDFNYILPEDKFDADLIIISTKANGLNNAIKNINNFVSNKTIIISLLNGISSEEIIKTYYPNSQILKSYFIGHSAIRKENQVSQDGVGEIVIEKNIELEEIFKELQINYSIAEDIDYSLWLKYTFNIVCNQLSAVLNMNFGELKQNRHFIETAKKIIAEVKPIAEKKGIKNLDKLEQDTISNLDKMCNEGKTSMLQDILNNKKTEVEIFAGEIIKMGKEFNIPTPYNQVLYDLIKIAEGK